jgi:hypothetical protein
MTTANPSSCRLENEGKIMEKEQKEQKGKVGLQSWWRSR